MPTHRGQVAFVGGHKQSGENDPWGVVTREFIEETQHSSSIIEFMGYLPVVMTARFQPIVPVVAKLKISGDEFLSSSQSNGEWSEIFSYPWHRLTQEHLWEFAWRNGYTRSPVMFHAIGAGTFASPKGEAQAMLLWGATASMIWQFLHLYHHQD